MLTIKYINQVSLVFPSRSANEGFARSAAASFAAQLDPTLDELGDVKTAVSEAVTNAIVHAYPDALGKVELKLRLYPENEFEVVVRDWGVGIENIDQARAPLFTTGSEERAGMGFTIMESFMDTVKVRSRPGKGTTVTMRKRFALPRGECPRSPAPGRAGRGSSRLRAARGGKPGAYLEHRAPLCPWSFGAGRPVSAGLPGLSQGGAGV